MTASVNFPKSPVIKSLVVQLSIVSSNASTDGRTRGRSVQFCEKTSLCIKTQLTKFSGQNGSNFRHLNDLNFYLYFSYDIGLINLRTHELSEFTDWGLLEKVIFYKDISSQIRPTLQLLQINIEIEFQKNGKVFEKLILFPLDWATAARALKYNKELYQYKNLTISLRNQLS